MVGNSGIMALHDYQNFVSRSFKIAHISDVQSLNLSFDKHHDGTQAKV